MIKERYEPTRRNNEKAQYMMSEEEKKLSGDYAVASERMAEMGIAGNIDLIWEGVPYGPDPKNAQSKGGVTDRALLKGVINGNEVELRGPSGYGRNYVKRIPLVAGTGSSAYTGNVNGIALDGEIAKKMFGMLMGVAIEKEEKDKARETARKESAVALIAQITGHMGHGQHKYSYPESESKPKKSF